MLSVREFRDNVSVADPPAVADAEERVNPVLTTGALVVEEGAEHVGQSGRATPTAMVTSSLEEREPSEAVRRRT